MRVTHNGIKIFLNPSSLKAPSLPLLQSWFSALHTPRFSSLYPTHNRI